MQKVQMRRMNRRLLACGVAVSTTVVSAVTTNVWQGAATGGLWSEPGNWSRVLTPTVETVYDFSALADGGDVTNDFAYSQSAAQLKIAGLVFGAGRGRITLSGTPTSETIFAKSTSIDVPAGTTLDCKLRHTTGPWKDQGAVLSFASSGAVRFSGSAFKPTLWTFAFRGADASATFDRVGGTFGSSRLLFEASRVTVNVVGDVAFAEIYDRQWPNSWPTDANRIVGDGTATLTLTSGYDLRPSSIKYTQVTGFQTVVMNGGGSLLCRGPTLSGRYVFQNFDVDYGRAWKPSLPPENNVMGGLQLPLGAAVDLDGNARVRFACDQFLSTLSGRGTHGRLDIGGVWADDSGDVLTPGALTVGEGLTAETGTVFHARLAGAGGGFVKKGPAYELTLTGANVHTGATRVAEGRLTLRRSLAYDETVCWWSFDGMDQTRPKAGPSRRSFWFGAEGAGSVVPVEDGVRGTRAVHLDGARRAGLILSSGAGGPLVTGNAPHSIQLWIRPAQDGCCATKSRLTYVLDYGTNWGADFTRARVVLYRTAEASDDYVLVFTPKNYNSAAVPIGYGVNVPLKGAELFDGKWHQLTWVYGREPRLLEAYLDGVCRGSDRLASDLQLPENDRLMLGYYDGQDVNYYTGGMDELKVFAQALSPEKVARSAVFADVQASAPTPTPVVRWTFDDMTNIGADACGIAPLVAVAGQPAPRLVAATHAIGQMALEKGHPLQAECPACLPTGSQSFTVSCRYLASGDVSNSPILLWGDPAREYGHFRLQTASTDLRSPGVGYSSANSLRSSWNAWGNGAPAAYHATGAAPGSEPSAAWTDFAVSYDGAARVLAMYVDGFRIGTQANVSLMIEAGDVVRVGHQTIDGKTTTFPGLIDDISIFDRALSDDEVRAVARSLHGEAVDQVIARSPVTVESGATLAFEGPSHALTSLAAKDGTLDIAYEADFTPPAGPLSVGALTGRGLLDITSGVDCMVTEASGFGGTVRVAEGGLFALAASSGTMAGDVFLAPGARLKASDGGTPAPIRTAGRIVLPSSLTVVVPNGTACGHPFALVEADGILMDPPAWRYETPDGRPLTATDYRVLRTATGVSCRRRSGFSLFIRCGGLA